MTYYDKYCKYKHKYITYKKNHHMKEKVIELIRILGVGLNELVFDFEIDGTKFNSIEWKPEEDVVLLHIFEDDETDIFCDFEAIDIDKQIKVYKILTTFLN
mgnify:CR=1 FL=1